LRRCRETTARHFQARVSATVPIDAAEKSLSDIAERCCLPMPTDAA
jgi:hypothetical protein